MGNSNSIMETEQRGGKKIQRNTNGLNTWKDVQPSSYKEQFKLKLRDDTISHQSTWQRDPKGWYYNFWQDYGEKPPTYANGTAK
jgi:hypothetical protein